MTSTAIAGSSDPKRPNIVIVLADDLGWGDPQCYNERSKIPTPSIDRIASAGLRFTDAHTPSSVCTPTRYTLLTGRYAWRTRLKSGVLDGFDPPLIGPNEDTLASLLKRAGYRTHCVGKWHLGMQWTTVDGNPVVDRDVTKGFRPGTDIDFTRPFSGGPIDVGFDSYFGISASLDMSPYCFLRGHRVVEVPTLPTSENRDGLFMNQVAGVTTTDFDVKDVLPRIASEAASVVRRSAAHKDPFFVYMPLTSPHLPVVPADDVIGTSDAGRYGDFVVATDRALGAVLTALDETEQSQNTLVLFTSDNGGLFHWWDFRAADDGGRPARSQRGEHMRPFAHQSNGGWRGTKADIYEGGHRVPFVMRWPGGIDAGRVVEQTVELTDVFATISELVGEAGRATSGMDSFSMLPLFRDSTATEVRPAAIHHSLRGVFAIRRGHWKFIDGRGSGGFTRPRSAEDDGPSGQLYNLADDPRETTNLFGSHPAIVESLRTSLDKVRATSAKSALK